MGKLELLIEALEYMEEHLQDEICTEDIAAHCFCSKSTLEKLFRCINRMSVRDYLVRRRISCAAKALVEEPDRSVLDIAVQYGYSSNEAFTRAFKQIWNCQPSKFRETSRNLELFPRVEFREEKEEDGIMRRFDISELYDLFRERKDCYFVCGDINSLIPINDISIKAGDLAIIESMRRMEEACGEDDLLFRIGGDEFVILTNSRDICYAEGIAEKIKTKNGEPIVFEGQEIPLRLYVTITKQDDENVRYSELFSSLCSAMRDSKKRVEKN